MSLSQALLIVRILRTLLTINHQWHNQSPKQFKQWLLQQKRQQTAWVKSEDLSFFKLWSARIAKVLWPNSFCVLASAVFFLLVEDSRKISIGIRKDQGKLFSHAWADGPHGGMQTDQLGHYEALWEISI